MSFDIHRIRWIPDSLILDIYALRSFISTNKRAPESRFIGTKVLGECNDSFPIAYDFKNKTESFIILIYYGNSKLSLDVMKFTIGYGSGETYTVVGTNNGVSMQIHALDTPKSITEIQNSFATNLEHPMIDNDDYEALQQIRRCVVFSKSMTNHTFYMFMDIPGTILGLKLERGFLQICYSNELDERCLSKFPVSVFPIDHQKCMGIRPTFNVLGENNQSFFTILLFDDRSFLVGEVTYFRDRIVESPPEIIEGLLNPSNLIVNFEFPGQGYGEPVKNINSTWLLGCDSIQTFSVGAKRSGHNICNMRSINHGNRQNVGLSIHYHYNGRCINFSSFYFERTRDGLFSQRRDMKKDTSICCILTPYTEVKTSEC